MTHCKEEPVGVVEDAKETEESVPVPKSSVGSGSSTESSSSNSDGKWGIKKPAPTLCLLSLSVFVSGAVMTFLLIPLLLWLKGVRR